MTVTILAKYCEMKWSTKSPINRTRSKTTVLSRYFTCTLTTTKSPQCVCVFVQVCAAALSGLFPHSTCQLSWGCWIRPPPCAWCYQRWGYWICLTQQLSSTLIFSLRSLDIKKLSFSEELRTFEFSGFDFNLNRILQLDLLMWQCDH